MKEAVSLSQATNRLKVLRDSGVRQSQESVRLAEVILSACGRVSQLGDDRKLRLKASTCVSLVCI
jgi:hypothetical protein